VDIGGTKIAAAVLDDAGLIGAVWLALLGEAV
jgi:hypothetical protein